MQATRLEIAAAFPLINPLAICTFVVWSVRRPSIGESGFGASPESTTRKLGEVKHSDADTKTLSDLVTGVCGGWRRLEDACRTLSQAAEPGFRAVGCRSWNREELGPCGQTGDMTWGWEERLRINNNPSRDSQMSRVHFFVVLFCTVVALCPVAIL